MTFISYADNLEDVMLWRAFRDLERGYYIEIRAGSRARGSATRAFHERGWAGLHVTSDTGDYQRLANERPRDIHLNSSVGSSNADSVKTLAAIWQDCLPSDQPVQFLHLDAPGTAKHVIEGNDWSRFRPWIVVIALQSAAGVLGSNGSDLTDADATQGHSPETDLPETDLRETDSHLEWERLLLGHQYRFAYTDGLKRFYVAAERAALLTHFQYPPNALDGYITESHQRAESALAETTLRLRAMEGKYQEILRQSLGAKSETDRVQAQQIELKAQLQGVYDSLSWRITSPVRRLQSILRNLLGAGWKSRLKSAIKRPIVSLAKKLLSHRAVKALVVRLATRLGVYERFRSLLSGQSFFSGQGPNEPYAPSRYWIATARSRRVRADLNAEIDKIKREST